MADNVTLPGTGAVVATDEVGGAQYQIIKIAIGPDGTATILPGDGANGVDVDVTRLPVDATTAANAKVTLRGYDYRTSEAYVDIYAIDTGEGGPYGLLVGNTADTPLSVDLGSGILRATTNSSWIDAGTATLTPKFAVISCSSSGNNTIVAAVASKKIRVLALSITESGAVNAKFQSAAGGTDKTGLYYLAEKGGLVLPFNQLGWFETVAGELLNLNLSAAVPVGGCLTYIEV
jgi:hypothetical protein